MIAAARESIGLPRPREVIVTSVSARIGVPPAHAFPKLRRRDDSERRHAHALLGAGRYPGYGPCRAIRTGSETAEQSSHDVRR